MRELDSFNCALDGVNLVEAAAGTGKTHNIQNIVVRLLIERDLAIETVVVVTYTESAANELRIRLREVIQDTIDAACGRCGDEKKCGLPADEALQRREERARGLLAAARARGISQDTAAARLRTALLDFDKAPVGTIHSFCRSLLRDFAFESGEVFDTELLTENDDLRDAFAADAYRSFCYGGDYAALYAQMLDFDVLKKLVKLKSSRRELTILPESEAGAPPLEELASRFMTAWERFRATENKKALIEPLLPLLYKKSYSSSDPGKVEAMAERAVPSSADMAVIGKFRPSFINARTLKDGADQVRRHIDENGAFFALMEELTALWKTLKTLLRDEAISRGLRHYGNYKRKHARITYDDMIHHVCDALDRQEFVDAVSAHFKAGIIDEFQDTDPDQWKIFRTLFEKSILFLVGDPRQAIYGFRGGDIAAYLAARSFVPEERRFTLTTNRRSCEGLVKEVNRWFGKHVCGFAHPDIRLPQIGTPGNDTTKPLLVNGAFDPLPLKIVECTEDNRDAAIADAVWDLLTSKDTILSADKKIMPRDIAILVSGWSYAEGIRKELISRNIPCAVSKTGNVFLTPAAEQLEIVLTGILSPSDRSAVRSALATPLCGITLQELAQTAETAPPRAADLTELKRIWQERSFYVMFRELLKRFRTESRLAVQDDGEKQMADLIQTGDLLHMESSRRKLSPQALLEHLIWCRTKTSPEQFPCEQGTEGNAVVICSEHGSKGLQYPIVILPCLNCSPRFLPSVYHDADGRTVASDGEGGDTDRARDEKLQESLRLAYVAMTRARQACIVIATPVQGNKLTPLNWLWFNREKALPATGSPAGSLKGCTDEQRQLPQELRWDITPADRPFRPEEEETPLAVRELTKPLPRPLTVTSYTALAPGHGPDGGLYFSRDDDEPGSDPGETLSLLPAPPPERLKGKLFGLLLHGIMENLDFHADPREIRKIVQREMPFPDPSEEELDHTVSVITNTLALPLFPGVPLADIPAEKRRSEMRFHFSFHKALDRKKLLRLAAEGLPGRIPADSGDPGDFPDGGYVTGSIDLVFEHGGKYFVLDWKSNLLPDYSRESLARSMAESFYKLQYLIYLAAFIRYLRIRLRLPAFGEEEYEKYIGGVFYIYMRGTDPAMPGNGIFFDRPAFSDVAKVQEVFE